jgi:type VI protein secretion system component VasK
MTQSLNHGFEHTIDSYFAVDEKKKGRCEGLVKERRAGLARSRSMIITLQSPDAKKSRRGNLTFSHSLRELSRAGTSRRHLVTDESEEAFSNCVRQLSRAGTSRCEGLVEERRVGLARSRSMIITLQSPDGKKSRRGNLTFSHSLRELSRAGTSRRHLVTDESEEALSNCVRQLSRAGTSRRHLVTEKKKGRCEGLVQERRAGLARSRSMIITLQSPDAKKSRRGDLTFSHSLRQLSRAGTSRRHLVTDESEEAFSNCIRQLSRAGTSRRYLVTDDAKQRQ